MKRTHVILVILALAPALGACRYTFIPLVPAEVQGTFPARVRDARLARLGPDLTLEVTLDPRTRAGYLTVVWYREDTELGRDSAYLDADEPTAVFRLAAAQKGNYRAVLSYEGSVLRQFELPENNP